jgi:hypothetical protein
VLPVALVALGLGVSACGDDDGSAEGTDAGSTPSASAPSTPDPAPTSDATEEVPPGSPACADVWQVGERIPRGYAGCVEDGAFVESDVLGCSSGQRLVRFDDTFYGVLGGTVRQAAAGPLTDDADYRRSVRSCRA